MTPANELTVLLKAWRGGDGQALDRLTTLVYDVGDGEKRGHYGGDGGENGATFQLEPFPLDRRFVSRTARNRQGRAVIGHGEANPCSGMAEGYGRETGRRTQGAGYGRRIPREGKNAARRAPSCERCSHHFKLWMSRRDASPFWSASAERQALKARRGETRTGLDAQLATRAEHAIAVSGPRPEMPLASFALLLLLINMPPAARLR